MNKLMAVLSLLTIVATYSGCQDHRNDRQEERDTSEQERGTRPTELERGYDGREMGGGGGNAN